MVLLQLFAVSIFCVGGIHGDFLQKCDQTPEQEGSCPTGYRMGPLMLRHLDGNDTQNVVSFVAISYAKLVGDVNETGDNARDETNLDTAASNRMSHYTGVSKIEGVQPEPEVMVTKEVYEIDTEDEPNGGLGRYPHFSRDYGYAVKPQETCIDRCIRSKYRTINGECNNLKHPYYGRSDSCLNRLLPPAYEDGKQAMRLNSVRGGPLPNPRLISQEIHSEVDNPEGVNQWMMHWGQLTNHDLVQTIFPLRPDLQPILCCRGEYHPECRPINVPRDDPFFSQFNVQCLDFLRSIPCYECNQGFRQRDGKESGTREILSRVTSWWDASLLYGNNHNVSTLIRTFKGGMLKSSSSASGRMLLPVSENPLDFCTLNPKFDFCFMSGDPRVNTTPGIAAAHLIMLRQHNRLAKRMQEVNPHWSDEQIYQEVRRILGAQLQVITYADYLPAVLGRKVMDNYQLTLLSKGRTKYNPKINPAILNEFQTAAFRFAHSQIEGKMRYISKEGKVTEFNLREVFFNAKDLVHDRFDDILRGALYVPTQTFDPFLDNDVRNHLFEAPKEPFGQDLASLNIQRGRDQGVAGYTSYLEFCYDLKIKDWSDLKRFIPASTLTKLASIYKDPADIDLWTGGLSENRIEGCGLVGPTFSCILGIQFFRLKYGDRYWHEHSDEDGSFNDAQLESIRQTTLSKLICANSDGIDKIHLNIFYGPSKKDPPIPCDAIPDIDLSLWKDRDGSDPENIGSQAEPEPGRPGYAQIKLRPEAESYETAGGVAIPLPAIKRTSLSYSAQGRSDDDDDGLDGPIFETGMKSTGLPGRSYVRQYNTLEEKSRRYTTVLK